MEEEKRKRGRPRKYIDGHIGSKVYAARMLPQDLAILEDELKGNTFTDWVRMKLYRRDESLTLSERQDLAIHAYMDGCRSVDELMRELIRELNDGEIAFRNGHFEAVRQYIVKEATMGGIN